MCTVVLPRPLRYHPVDHPYFLAPNFTEIALSDEQKIVDAVDYVLQARSKMVTPSQKQDLINTIRAWARAENVGALRHMTDDDWRQLKIPLMARVFLKQLVTQAPALSELELLECDFNNGMPLNMEQCDDKVKEICNMGFTRAQALEALLITGTGDTGSAVSFLLMEPNAKIRERDRARRRMGRNVKPTHHHSQLKVQEENRSYIISNQKKSTQQLKAEVKQVSLKLKEAQNDRKRLEDQLDKQKRDNEKKLFTEFIRGMVADRRVNSVENARCQSYQERKNIDQKMFNEILLDLGYSEEEFEAIKNFDNVTTVQDDECLICFEPPKNQLLIPSMQVALCPNCACEWRGERNQATIERGYPNCNPNIKCPNTDQPIDEIVEVVLSW